MLTKDIELLRKENEEIADKMRKAEEGMYDFFKKFNVKIKFRGKSLLCVRVLKNLFSYVK